MRVVKFCFVLQKQQKEYVVTRQLLKSGTSIGANVEEAQQPQSRADFTSKMSIALKEAYESRYWLRLIRDSGLSGSPEIQILLDDLDSIIRLLATSTYSSRKTFA